MALPDFPAITGVDWTPPSETNPVEVYRKAGSMWIYADADNANFQDWVLDVEKNGQNVFPRLNNWWGGNAPQAHELVMRQYWKIVPGTFLHLIPGTHVQKSWQYTHGVSTTDSQSISVQVGIQSEGLSAGLSATTSHSITISDQQTETTEYSIDPPASGTRVWVLWDLTYEFIVAKPKTNDPIPAGQYRGDVAFSGDRHYSGAYLNYSWTHKTISAGLLCPQDKIFT